MSEKLDDLQVARNFLERTLPIVGVSGRGFAQELLAEICLFLGDSPYNWTAHPDTLTQRIGLLPARKRKILERRRAVTPGKGQE
jgi:hypothetical protein